MFYALFYPWKHKKPSWNTYLYPGTDIIFAIRGTTRIESQSCIVLSKIPLFMRNVQSTYQPTIIISALQYFSFNRSAPECSLLSSFPKQCSQSVTLYSCRLSRSWVFISAFAWCQGQKPETTICSHKSGFMASLNRFIIFMIQNHSTSFFCLQVFFIKNIVYFLKNAIVFKVF